MKLQKCPKHGLMQAHMQPEGVIFTCEPCLNGEIQDRELQQLYRELGINSC